MNSKYLALAKKNRILSKLIFFLYAIKAKKNREREPYLFREIELYLEDKNPSLSLVADMLRELYIGGFKYQEYFMFDFPHKNAKQRHEYLGTYEKHDWVKSITTPESNAIFDNKYLAYQTFEPYYKRDVVYVESMESFLEYSLFVANHRRFIVKPVSNMGGNGVSIIDLDIEQGAKSVFARILGYNGALCEELVSQDDQMARFHPSSVNTVRVVTYYSDNELTILYAFCRIGAGDSMVDNTSAGGLAAQIDVATGEIITPAIRRMSKDIDSYEIHPDTKAQIKGAIIPKWDELLSMVSELVKIVPAQKYVGWDLALTHKGWVMIEGNSQPLITTIQVLENKGIRKKIEALK